MGRQRKKLEITADERAALDLLVPPDHQTGDLPTDLVTAIKETWRRREENTQLGAAVIRALYRDAQSWRTIEYLTGISRMTARRWATPPPEADADRTPTPEDQ